MAPTSVRPQARLPTGGAVRRADDGQGKVLAGFVVAQRFWCAVLVCCALIVSGRSVGATEDPAVTWYTIETAHFYVHYHNDLEEVARRVARYCEESHELLVPELGWDPGVKTHVVIDDTTDVANGFASILPRNTIRLLVSGPEARSNLGYFDDWLRLLVLHEYVHILHIDTHSGIPAWINTILGKTYVPNQILPRWYIEGLATFHESRHTQGGRVRSSLFVMQLRTAWLDDVFFELGELSGSSTRWPRGSAIYLYGSHFLDYVASTRGNEFFARYHAAYGERMVPYSVNTTARDILGTDFVVMWDEWKAHLAGRFLAQTMVRRLEGVTPLERLTHNGGILEAPRVRPGTADVSFFRADGYSDAALFSTDPVTGQVEYLFEIERGTTSHGWDPTGRYAFYHTTRSHKGQYAFNELVVHDTVTGESRQLTEGGRAREPAVHPDGRSLVFVENGLARTHLVRMDLETRRTERLVEAPVLGQMDYPSFSPDGRYVALSYQPDERGRDLYVYDMQTRRLLQLTRDRAHDLEPTFTPDGRYVVWSSDRDGIFDIYRVDVTTLEERSEPGDGTLEVLDLPTERVTRVLRGVFAPVVVRAADGREWLYVASFQDKGYDLARLVWTAPIDEAPPSRTEGPATKVPAISKDVSEPRDYNPIRWLAPLTVFPLFAFTNAGRDSYGLELTANDPVGRHFWTFVGEYFPETETGLALTNYGYNGLPVDLGLRAQYATFERSRSFFAGSDFVPFREEAWDLQGSLGLPIPGDDVVQSLSLGYNFRITDYFDEPEYTFEPVDFATREPTFGNFSSVFLSYGASLLTSRTHSPGSVRGFNISVVLRMRDDWTGSDRKSTELTYSGRLFVPVPVFENHVLGFKGAGGIGRTESRGRLFSLGGVPPQEVFTALINETPLGGTFLRGFEPFTFSGNSFQLVGTEYRLPFYDANLGWETLPFFVRRITLGIFGEAGTAYDGPISEAEWHYGTGAELRISADFGYTQPAAFRLGYAHGFGEDSISEVYFFFGGAF